MRQLLRPGWLARHLLAAVAAGGCLALGWWQIRRAAGGNGLSWAYAFEWPLFAGFVALIWGREVRQTLRGDRHRGTGPPTADRGPAGESASAGVDATGTGDIRAGAPGAPPGVRRPVVTARRGGPPADGGDDPELAAYNRMLAWLAANPGARPTDYPG